MLVCVWGGGVGGGGGADDHEANMPIKIILNFSYACFSLTNFND